MNIRPMTLTMAIASVAACAHSEDLTGDEHRAAAVHAEEKAELEKREYDPDARARVVARPIADVGVDVMQAYNPTASHLDEADRQMRIAYEHMKFAQRLDMTEDAACAGVSVAERTSCPLLAPSVERVEESSRGVTLHLKSSAPAERLAAQLRCHLAFARANDFERVPCRLFIKGVSITLREGRLIDILATDGKVAASVRYQARLMFGQAGEPIADR